jgi:hypothetical protein
MILKRYLKIYRQNPKNNINEIEDDKWRGILHSWIRKYIYL